MLKSISQIRGIKEFDADIESKRVKIKYDNKLITRDMIKSIINESIVNGKSKTLENYIELSSEGV